MKAITGLTYSILEHKTLYINCSESFACDISYLVTLVNNWWMQSLSSGIRVVRLLML